jgi:Protein of unknown function (DUF4065)
MRRRGIESGTVIVPDDNKFRALILYICLRSEGDGPFGAVKLNKELFLSDFDAYLLMGHPITGEEYQALDQGPAPRKIVPVLRDMEDRGDVATRQDSYFGLVQKRTLALREPDLSVFKPEEIALVDGIIIKWWGRTAKEISLAPHEFIGWRAAKIGETIPYAAALVDTREPTKSEWERGKHLEQRARELLSGHGGG